jgi:glycosyltransferase involved in cell wall biosynthesis
MTAPMERVRQELGRWRELLRLAAPPEHGPIAKIAINMRPARTSWGGGSQWVQQMSRYLSGHGYAVVYDLDRDTDCVVLVDPRVGGLVAFGPDEIRAHKRRFPDTYCIHRINENDQRKNTDHIDRLLTAANEVADHTVFISEWLRQYHCERWFDWRRPHSVITNGADPRLYHAVGSAKLEIGGTLRLVTHHWSDNWAKGFTAYQEIDRLIAEGELKDTELWVIGRWPKEIRWQAARTFLPTQGARLSRLLRRCHVYVTASQWEPGGMHFIEGAQCGLPVLYHVQGGGIVEVARKFGVPFGDDVRSAIHAIRDRYPELRRAVLADGPSGDQMCLAYARLIQQGILLGSG